MRKFVEAEWAKTPAVEVWSAGTPVREFNYVEHFADAIVLATELYDDAARPLNVGTVIGTTIRELSETDCAVSGDAGKIIWNSDKPDGAMLKVLDVTQMNEALEGWTPPTYLRTGLEDDVLVPGQQSPGRRKVVSGLAPLRDRTRIRGADGPSPPRSREKTRAGRAVVARAR